MVDWLGEQARVRNATRTLSYHTYANRLDICMQSSLFASLSFHLYLVVRFLWKTASGPGRERVEREVRKMID
jgi:hypothetical protein